MARETTIQTAFNAGEWRATLDGRIDQERYRAACRRLRNFQPLVEGPATFRPGARLGGLAASQNEAEPATLIPFRFSTAQAYALEFGQNTMRVWTNGGIVLSGMVPYSIATPYTAAQARQIQFRQNADVMWLAHPDVPPQRLSRFADDNWTITPYDPNWPPFRIENIDQTVTVYASARTGAVTLTASSALFLPGHVGLYFRLRDVPASEYPNWVPDADPIAKDGGQVYGGSISVGDFVQYEGNVYQADSSPAPATTGTRPPIHGPYDQPLEFDGRWYWRYAHSGSGYVQITAYTSPTQVSATVVSELPDSVIGAPAATFRFAFGAWDSFHGYPRALAFFEDRLWWGGTNADPDSIWATRPGGDYDDFRPSDDAEGALQNRLNNQEPNVIEAMEATRVLHIMTAGGVFPAAGADPSIAASIENLLSVERQVSYGARAGVQAVAIDNVVVYVQRSGRALREILFDDNQQSFAAPDLAKVSAHLIASGVARLAYQQEPNRTLWALLEDGGLVAATYDRPQEVLGWWQIDLGAGSSDAVIVEGLCVIPHPDQDVDQVWIAVARRRGASTTRTIEFFERNTDENQLLEDAFFVDSGVSYSGPPATTVSGLIHLEGETVRVLADGARVADRVVSGGQVTLDDPASKIHVGLGYDGLVAPMRLEAGGEQGVAQGQTKRIIRVVIRFWRTAEGTYYGAVETLADLDLVVWRTAFDLMDDPVPLKDDDTRSLEWPGEYEQGGYLVVRHAAPTPCTVVAVIPQVISGAY